MSVAAEGTSVLDLPATARRLRRVLSVLAVLVVVGWSIAAITTRGPALDRLADLVGLALLAAFVAEVVVVGGAALRGMLLAGARGKRLAGADVSLVPPQLACALRRVRRPGGAASCGTAEGGTGDVTPSR